MIILFPAAFIFSAFWLAWCAALAGRGLVARILLGVLGGVLFIAFQAAIPQLFREQIRELLFSYEDRHVILGVVTISVALVFFIGLLLLLLLKKRTRNKNSQPRKLEQIVSSATAQRHDPPGTQTPSASTCNEYCCPTCSETWPTNYCPVCAATISEDLSLNYHKGEP